MPSNKILSFCIPTLGQPKQIKLTLDSLVGQNLQDVEIIIRDDNSNDETEKIVSKYLSKLPIRYFHLKKEGIDRAFIFLSKEARGDFVWWFGDDILCLGTFKLILSILKEYKKIDFMYINSADMSGTHYSIPIKGSHFFKDRNDVLNQIRDQLGFCSAMLFRKEILLDGLLKVEKVVGSSWATLFLALNSLVVGNSFYYLDGKNFLSDPKVAGEARWYDSFEVHGINFYQIVEEFSDYFDRSLVHKLLSEKFRISWKAVIVERAMGFYTGFASPNPKILKMTRLYWSFPDYYIALPLMILPRPILKVCYSLYKKFKGFQI